MNRTERGIAAASDAARMSSYGKYKLGAAIYLGSRLISIGWNSTKTSPGVPSLFNWHHAETSALIGTSKYDLSRATMYVVRLGRSGALRCSRPCSICQELIYAAGIRKVVYVDKNGQVTKENLNG